VEVTGELDEASPASPGTSDADREHAGLGAGGGEADKLGAGDDRADALGPLKLKRVIAAEMGAARKLAADGPDDIGMTVAEDE
jgi:hypothetical protein